MGGWEGGWVGGREGGRESWCVDKREGKKERGVVGFREKLEEISCVRGSWGDCVGESWGRDDCNGANFHPKHEQSGGTRGTRRKSGECIVSITREI